MEPVERAAFLIAQAAMLNAEIARMQAENQHRMNCGNNIAYGDAEFRSVIAQYESTLGYNGALLFLRS